MAINQLADSGRQQTHFFRVFAEEKEENKWDKKKLTVNAFVYEIRLIMQTAKENLRLRPTIKHVNAANNYRMMELSLPSMLNPPKTASCHEPTRAIIVKVLTKRRG